MNTNLSCTVVSLVPFTIREEKPGLIPSRYFIPASDSIVPQILHVGPAMHYVYLDETRGNLQIRDAANEVARSLVQDYAGAQLVVNEDSTPGIFWVPGVHTAKEIEEKYSEQLVEVKIKQRKWFTLICRLADDDWNKFHQHNVVSDFQRRVATILGLNPEEHEWMNPEIKIATVTCFACGSPVGLTIAVCPVCRCILDQDKYNKLKFA